MGLIRPRHDGTKERRALPVFDPARDIAGRFGGQRAVLRQLLAARRALLVVALTPPCCAIQAVLLLLPGRAKVVFARIYWALVAASLGLSVRVVGRPAVLPPGRRVVYVSNHSSWLDIPALGSTLHACFVSKDQVGRWPVIGTVARLGRSVFISRTRTATVRERDEMRAALERGDDLVLFPEGTSSDGSRVLPFRSSFFGVAHGKRDPGETLPIVQPVSVVYDRLGGLPVGRASRTEFSWFGDMSLAPHAWRVAQWRGKRVTVLLHPALDPADFETRKALAEACWQVVADGAAALRQNRAPAPQTVSEIETAAAPAFA